jgi:hypothetical protein
VYSGCYGEQDWHAVAGYLNWSRLEFVDGWLVSKGGVGCDECTSFRVQERDAGTDMWTARNVCVVGKGETAAHPQRVPGAQLRPAEAHASAAAMATAPSCRCHEGELALKLGRRAVPQSRVPTMGVVEPFDIVEDPCSRLAVRPRWTD